MTSFMTSVVWSCPVLSFCCTEHDPSRDAVLSGHITVVAMSRSGQLGRRCTVAANTYVDSSVTHECALETREPSCVRRVARHFFIPTTHRGVVGHVAAPKLPSQEGRAPSHWTRGSTEAPLSEGRASSRGRCGSTETPLSGRQSPEPCHT
jgi:hypothetical protein